MKQNWRETAFPARIWAGRACCPRRHRAAAAPTLDLLRPEDTEAVQRPRRSSWFQTGSELVKPFKKTQTIWQIQRLTHRGSSNRENGRGQTVQARGYPSGCLQLGGPSQAGKRFHPGHFQTPEESAFSPVSSVPRCAAPSEPREIPSSFVYAASLSIVHAGALFIYFLEKGPGRCTSGA